MSELDGSVAREQVEPCREAMKSPSAKSRVSPGRNGKNSPHSTKTMTRLIQKSAVPNWSSSQLGSIQLDAEEHRVELEQQGHGSTVPGALRSRTRQLPRPDGLASTVPAVDDLDAEAVLTEEARAPYDPMPHGPDEVGVGPWQGPWPTGEQYDARAAGRGRPAQRGRPLPLLDDGGDRRRPRHPPPRLPRRDRELAARLQHRHDRAHRPTRSSPPRCTSSATGAGTAAARWSPTATSTCATTPTVADLAAYLHEQRRPGAPARHRQPAGLAAPRDDRRCRARVCFLFGQEGPGLSEPARARPATGPSRSRSSARPARSTPRPRPRSPCTPGSATYADLSGDGRLARLSPGSVPGLGRRGRPAAAVEPARGVALDGALG